MPFVYCKSWNPNPFICLQSEKAVPPFCPFRRSLPVYYVLRKQFLTHPINETFSAILSVTGDPFKIENRPSWKPAQLVFTRCLQENCMHALPGLDLAYFALCRFRLFVGDSRRTNKKLARPHLSWYYIKLSYSQLLITGFHPTSFSR